VCDDKIQSHTTFYSGDELVCNVIGNGGTDFRPVFEYIQNEIYDTSLLLYFTDLEGIFPHAKPSFDIKWIVPKEKQIPFGEVIVLG
jgi:predicted metal-dependent peptidase